MNQSNEVNGRMAGCQSTNHTECYGELWQCAVCSKTVCYAEGTDDHPELCDDCWAKRYVQDSDVKRSDVTTTSDITLLMDCACTEESCATWLALTADGVLTLEDRDGLCVSILLPTWLDDAVRTALAAHVQSAPQAQSDSNLLSRVGCEVHSSNSVTIKDPAVMGEGEYMDYVLERLRSGKAQPYAKLTDDDLETIEEEHIGAEFCRCPFLY